MVLWILTRTEERGYHIRALISKIGEGMLLCAICPGSSTVAFSTRKVNESTMRLFFLVLLLGAFDRLGASTVNIRSIGKIGTVFDLERSGALYFTAAIPDAIERLSSNTKIPSDLIPATSFLARDSPITRDFFESQINLYSEVDDVWNQKFIQTVIISYDGPGTALLDDQAKTWLEKSEISRLYVSPGIRVPVVENVEVSQIISSPIPGPYIISLFSSSAKKIGIHSVYRLYLDEYDSFLFGAIPNPIMGGWMLTNITLPSSINEGLSQYIPVPSRLSYLSSSLPFTGIRFGLKDIYDAQGLPTGAGSLAYQLVHPIPNKTASSISKLLSLGAVMVGKTRTSQFAHGANPWEFLDVSYSWNPRGDGYLTASSSSSGSACAIAGYEWLDFAVGSDTRGSVRKPAALVGVYGIRPTLGSLDMEGVVPLSEEMDTAGFFARDPMLFYEIHRLWYVDSPVADGEQLVHFPSKLMYPIDHFPIKNPAAQQLYDAFVSALHQVLGIVPLHVNMTSLLLPHFPEGGFSAFQLSSNKLAEYRSWKSVGKPVVDLFSHKYGSLPTFDPVPQKMFARALNISEQDYLDAIALKHNFRDAMSWHIFRPNAESCSESLFMYDAATGGIPSYRIEEFNAIEGATPFLLTAAGPDGELPQAKDFFNFLASMGELPEVTLPIGQVGYYSQVTREYEMLPVAVQLVTRRGCDRMLMELVRQLKEKDLIGLVKVGRRAF